MIPKSLGIAFRALGANKLRTFLTMLGIIIGVGAVIALLAIGQGASAAVEAQYAALGTNVLYVTPGSQNVSGVRSSAGSAQTLTADDAEALQEPGALPAVLAVAAERNFFGQVIANGVNTNTRIVAATPAYPTVMDVAVASGAFYMEEDEQAKAAVAVIGPTTATTLFADGDPIGQTLRINSGGGGGTGVSLNVRVVGVLQSKGGTGFANRDDTVLIPLQTGLTKLSSARSAGGGQVINQIDIKAVSTDAIPEAISQITTLLTQRLGSADAFQIRNTQDQIDARKQSSQTLTMLLGAISGISLVVGGIGIMNIMIVSVTERTHEIGIRKAVGARQVDILMQFMMEALVVSIVGGLLGVVAGVGTAYLVNGRTLNGQEIQTVIVPGSIVLAFAVAALAGLFFGIYPASRAARMNPIQALHYE